MKKIIFVMFFCLTLMLSSFAQEPSVKTVNPNNDKTDNLTKDAKTLMLGARKAKSEKPLSEIKDIKIISAVKILAGDIEVFNETTIKFPNKTLSVINGPFGEIKNAYNGTVAWAVTPGGVQEIVGDNALEFKNALDGEPILLLNNFDREGYQVKLLEEKSFQEQDVDTVLLTTDTEYEIKVYLDPKTHMLIGKAFKTKAAGFDTLNEEICSNFQTFEGIQIPMKRLIKRNGQPFAEVEVKEVKVNSGVDDKVFVKPQ